MTYAQIRAGLSQEGREVGHYKQSAQRANAPAALQGHIADGFCMGAALDWLRSVLHGGSAGQGPDVLTSGIAFVAQTAERRAAFFDDLKKRINALKADNQRQVNVELQQLNDRALAAVNMGRSVDEVQDAITRLSAQKQAAFTAKQKTLDDALKPDAVNARFWKEFSALMDAKFPNRPKYADLAIIRSSITRQYGPAQGVKDLIMAVLKDEGLKAGNGAVVGIYQGTRGGGHAIAIHRLNTGDYHLFDPNFGCYALDFYHVARVFLLLFLEWYPQLDDGSTADSRVYQVNGVVRGEYLIYRGTRTALPAVNHVG
jgi:hypothetical protein